MILLVLKEWVLVDGSAIKFKDLNFEPWIYFKNPSDYIHSIFHILKDTWNIVLDLEDKKKIAIFPRHFIFLNIQCLRCGLCCRNYESPDIFGKGDIIKK